MKRIENLYCTLKNKLKRLFYVQLEFMLDNSTYKINPWGEAEKGSGACGEHIDISTAAFEVEFGDGFFVREKYFWANSNVGVLNRFRKSSEWFCGELLRDDKGNLFALGKFTPPNHIKIFYLFWLNSLLLLILYGFFFPIHSYFSGEVSLSESFIHLIIIVVPFSLMLACVPLVRRMHLFFLYPYRNKMCRRIAKVLQAIGN